MSSLRHIQLLKVSAIRGHAPEANKLIPTGAACHKPSHRQTIGGAARALSRADKSTNAYFLELPSEKAAVLRLQMKLDN